MQNISIMLASIAFSIILLAKACTTSNYRWCTTVVLSAWSHPDYGNVVIVDLPKFLVDY